MIPALLLIVLIIFSVVFFTKKKAVSGNASVQVDAALLEKNVLFYAKLSPAEKGRFEGEIKIFLSTVKITPVDTAITDLDKLLVASGAIIPIFYFEGWHYQNLKEVLLYSDNINHLFETTGDNERDIMGMVGSGYMEGKMLLSKPALEQGFSNKTDKSNTVIHEFVHLIDKSDGETDGIPLLLLDKQYVLPWVDMIQQEMKKIIAGKSDINPYGITKQSEFFAVISEYFFERPDLLQSKHPEFYTLLQQMFKTPERK